jgi:hypothetical protein
MIYVIIIYVLSCIGTLASFMPHVNWNAQQVSVLDALMILIAMLIVVMPAINTMIALGWLASFIVPWMENTMLWKARK